MMTDYSYPYDAMAEEAMKGKRVVVFCDSQKQADSAKSALAATLRSMGAEKVVCPRRDRRVDVGGKSVRFVLANGIDGRGMSADSVYLSPSARMQHEFATLMGGKAK